MLINFQVNKNYAVSKIYHFGVFNNFTETKRKCEIKYLRIIMPKITSTQNCVFYMNNY